MSAANASKMQGKQATIKDITLDMKKIALPCNLLCGEESLSPDSEEEHPVYKVDSCCDNCCRVIRVVVVATETGIRAFQQLLTEEISFLCPNCSRSHLQHGRFH